MAAALVAGAAFAAALAAPSAALACNGGPSAVNVYTECIPSGGGNKAHKPPAKHDTGAGPSTSTSVPSSSPPVHVSKRTKKALTHAGKDKNFLHRMVTDPGLGGAARVLQSERSAANASPSALGSAFDLGSGPTVLMAVLAGTVVLLLGMTGVRSWRRWHRA